MTKKEAIRKDDISAIKLMLIGLGNYVYLTEPLELEEETIIALTWMGGEPAYTDSNGCQCGVGILCTDELAQLRKAMYKTVTIINNQGRI